MKLNEIQQLQTFQVYFRWAFHNESKDLWSISPNRNKSVTLMDSVFYQSFVLSWHQTFLLMSDLSGYGSYNCGCSGDTSSPVSSSIFSRSLSAALYRLCGISSHVHHVEAQRVSFLTDITISVFVPLHYNFKAFYSVECLEVAPKDECLDFRIKSNKEN